MITYRAQLLDGVCFDLPKYIETDFYAREYIQEYYKNCSEVRLVRTEWRELCSTPHMIDTDHDKPRTVTNVVI